MIISQNRIYVGFIFKVTKKRGAPEIGKGSPLFFSARLRYVFFVRLFLKGRTPALPSPLDRTKSVKTIPFRFLVQRYCFYLRYANFLAKKLQKYVVKHKKEGLSTPFPRSNNPMSDYASYALGNVFSL